MFHKNKMDSIIRFTCTVFYSLLYVKSRQGFNGLKYMCSVISVIMDSLPGNTKNRESTRSWTARVRLFHPWAGSRTRQSIDEISRTRHSIDIFIYIHQTLSLLIKISWTRHSAVIVLRIPSITLVNSTHIHTYTHTHAHTHTHTFCCHSIENMYH